jgi:hypothetical protein
MDVQQILGELEFLQEEFPREAVEAAVAQREQIVPELLRILEQSTAQARDGQLPDEYMANVYAMYLLAQFRETRAYPLLIEFLSLPGETALDATGDVITEDMDRILASVCGGDIAPMIGLALDEDANEYVRGAALRGVRVLYLAGRMSRDEAVAAYRDLFRRARREYSAFWDQLISAVTFMGPEELMDEIRQAYDEDLVDSFFISMDDVERALAQGQDRTLQELREHRKGLIDDTAAELESWARLPPEPVESASQGQRIVGPKIGRNQPCPCGSGKKYKKCCGANR